MHWDHVWPVRQKPNDSQSAAVCMFNCWLMWAFRNHIVMLDADGHAHLNPLRMCC
jgi:hypothetical protein